METWQKLLSKSTVKVKDLPFVSESKEHYEKLEKVAKMTEKSIRWVLLNGV